MNLCIGTCFVYLQPFCVTLDFKLFIDSIHILFLLYLLLWFWDFTIKNLQDFIKIYRALIKDIFLRSIKCTRCKQAVTLTGLIQFDASCLFKYTNGQTSTTGRKQSSETYLRINLVEIIQYASI